MESIRGWLKEAEGSKIALDTTALEYAMRKHAKKEVEEFATNPRDPRFVERLRKSVDLIPTFPFTVTLWEVQNICYPALVKAFEENGWGASPDPAMQQYFDNLLHLAEGYTFALRSGTIKSLGIKRLLRHDVSRVTVQSGIQHCRFDLE